MPRRKVKNGTRKSYKKRSTSGKPPVVRKLRKRIRTDNRALYRTPVSFGNLQPPRVRCRHVNYISKEVILSTAQPFYKIATSFAINRLRDPETDVASQVFPENFVAMAAMYKKYLVHGCQITCYYNGMSNNDNDRFISVFIPSDSASGFYVPLNEIQVNAMLQEKRMRRRKMYDASHYTPGGNVHDGGTFACARTVKDPNYYVERAIYEGAVNADGSVFSDPTKTVFVHHEIVSPQSGGFVAGGNQTLYLRYKLVFDVEWFDRRQVFEPTRTES